MTAAAPTPFHKGVQSVTVLYCDVVNSTGMAARVGAERMHAVINKFFEVAMTEIHRYGGTVNQFLGDGFMALFAASKIEEAHAVRVKVPPFPKSPSVCHGSGTGRHGRRLQTTDKTIM